MNPVIEFWNRHYPGQRPLESDSGARRVVNRYLVGGILNAFPKATTKLLSFSRGDFAQLVIVKKENGSYKTFQAMYDYEDPAKRGDIINRLLMQSPGVKAARNRRNIAQRMLHKSLEAQSPEKPVLVMVFGGGDGWLEAEVISRFQRKDIFCCVVDKDERAVEEIRNTFTKHGLEGRGAVFLGDITKRDDLLAVVENAEKRFNVSFEGADVAVCHGIAEYMDIGKKTNEEISKMLAAIHECLREEGTLLISHTDYHDRVRWVERGLGWYMRMRGMDEVADEIEKAGLRISICEHEPMQLITMCLAVKSDGRHLRIDSPSQPGRRRDKVPSVAIAR